VVSKPNDMKGEKKKGRCKCLGGAGQRGGMFKGVSYLQGGKGRSRVELGGGGGRVVAKKKESLLLRGEA